MKPGTSSSAGRRIRRITRSQKASAARVLNLSMHSSDSELFHTPLGARATEEAQHMPNMSSDTEHRETNGQDGTQENNASFFHHSRSHANSPTLDSGDWGDRGGKHDRDVPSLSLHVEVSDEENEVFWGKGAGPTIIQDITDSMFHDSRLKDSSIPE